MFAKPLFKPIYVLLFLFCFISISNALSSSFSVTAKGNDFTEVEFNLSDYEIILNRVEGIEFSRIYHPEAGYIFEEGLPEIPFFSTMLVIPDRGDISVEVISISETKLEEDFTLYPSQGFDLVISEETGFLYNQDFYKEDKQYPDKICDIGSPAVLRDYRSVSLAVFPFTYNPARQELAIHNKIKLRVSYEPAVLGVNELNRSSRKLSRSFESIYQGTFLNYDQFRNTDLEYQPRSILVIRHHSSLLDPTIEQFINWKRDKGFEINTASTATLTSSTAIKNYIQNAYNSWEHPPEYVVLIGGGSSSGSFYIQTFSGYGATGDHIYSLLDGNDDLPDVFIGRFPIADAGQLQTIWNKILNYEKVPYLENTDWYEHALLVGDGTTSSGESPRITIRYVKELMLQHNESYQFTEHYYGSASTIINNAFDQGISFFPFRGYIGMAGWSPSETIINGKMMPNCFFMTCSTLYFDNNSKAEKIVNMGTPINPKGAVSAIGMNTASTKTAFNNAYVGSFFYGIFNEGIRTMGETLVRGKIFLHETWDTVHPNEVPYHTHKASLMGDPSMDIWVETPKTLNVTYEESLISGANFIDISVTDEYNQPIENVWVTLRQVEGNDETLFVTDYTDQNGHITHFFDSDTIGSVNLTVTKSDYIPHIGSFEIQEGNSVGLHNVTVNGVVNAGNSIGFFLALKNYLDWTTNNLNATLATESEYITINQDYSTYPDISAGGITDSNSEYQITISSDILSGYKVFFDLTINESYFNHWTGRFAITVNNAHLEPVELTFSSGLTIEPTQTAEMYITLQNNGMANISSLFGSLSGGGYGLSILDDEAYFGYINSGGQGTNNSNSFVLSLSGTVIPGTIYELELHLYNASGFEQTLPLQLTVGTVSVTDPLGPDLYGYRCYDDDDTDYLEAPNYEWIEIAPTLGGNGVNTGLQSDHFNLHQVIVMDLPFTFQFYGVEYDLVSICANGWISFGATEQTTFRNYYLPGPMGPAPIVAAFWDNLSLSNGDVYTYYDQNQDIFIIQWQNAGNRVSYAEETFQIILYDPSSYYTSTGDGNIKIQYKVFNNLNNFGSPEWGNYCTVGIADHTENIGLTYTFANQYPTAAQPLTDESAILFTAGSIDLDNAYVTVDEISYTGGASYLPQFGETVSMNVTLNNIGGEAAGVVTATIATNDQYINVLVNTAEFGYMGTGDIVTIDSAFSISVADNVPDQHQAIVIFSIETTEGMLWEHNVRVTIEAPEFDIESPFIYDLIPGGNNDGIIDPGELITFSFPLHNVGNATSQTVDIDFVVNHPEVTIISVEHDERSSLLPDEVMYPSLVLEIADSITYGSSFSVDYTLDSGSYNTTGSFDFIVGGDMTVQLGSGTATNSGTAANPINIYYKSLRGQMVYTADELYAVGMTDSGNVTEFGFYVTSSPNLALPSFIIRMKHTTAENAASHDNGPFETVYQNQSYMPQSGGWDMLTLDTPFQWNGVDNILIDTAFALVSSWSSSGQQRIYTVTNGFRYSRSDSSDQTNAVTSTTSTNKPQAQIVFSGVSSGNVTIRPQNLTLEFNNDHIFLDWDPPTESRILFDGRTKDNPDNPALSRLPDMNNRTLLGYNVYRNGTKINQELVDNTEYTDYELSIADDYFYFVTAVYPDVESVASNIAYIELGETLTAPNFDPEGGYFNEALFVTLSASLGDTDIHYTTDGSEPDQSSPLYTEPIPITEVALLKAKAYRDGWIASPVGEEYYIVMYAPTNVTISRMNTEITIQWEESPGAVGYSIYAGDEIESEFWERLNTTTDTGYQFTITPDSERKFFRIRALYESTDELSRESRIGFNR